MVVIVSTPQLTATGFFTGDLTSGFSCRTLGSCRARSDMVNFIRLLSIVGVCLAIFGDTCGQNGTRHTHGHSSDLEARISNAYPLSRAPPAHRSVSWIGLFILDTTVTCVVTTWVCQQQGVIGRGRVRRMVAATKVRYQCAYHTLHELVVPAVARNEVGHVDRFDFFCNTVDGFPEL